MERKYSWNYRQAIGILTYLQGTSIWDISMATHQAARFYNNPKLSHERAVNRIERYLKATNDKGMMFKLDGSRGLEYYVDADLAGSWDKADSGNPDAVLSRTGYILMYTNYPVLLCRKLQMEIALSTAEAEYIALDQVTREVIPFINLLKEINKMFPLNLKEPKFYCKIFEDNNRCILLATVKQMFASN